MKSITLNFNKEKFFKKTNVNIAAIPSKSHAHRILIASALSDRKTHIIIGSSSKDIDASISCIRALGAAVEMTDDGLIVTPINCKSKIESSSNSTNLSSSIFSSDYCIPCLLDSGESGSTLRFLLPVIAALGKSAEFSLHGRLSERPLSPLYEELQNHGINLSAPGSNPIKISGHLRGGTFTIAGNISSQFITGLLLGLPLLDEDSEIHVTGTVESRPYIDITLDVLKTFGISIYEDKKNQIFFIRGGQFYHSPEEIKVSGDWSNAAFFLAAGALSPVPVTVTGLDFTSSQGDKAILDILENFGASITCTPPGKVTIYGKNLHGIQIDASNIPDLIPIISLVAAIADGKTVITNIERLRIKESDRAAAIITTLSNLSADIHEENNSLIITGKNELSSAQCDSFNDHRIAMTAGIASIRTNGSITIINPDAVQKSYPGFYDDLSSFNVSHINV